MRKTILQDFKTRLPLELPKIHGNKKIKLFISGRKLTMGQWRREATESAHRLIEALNDSTELTSI